MEHLISKGVEPKDYTQIVFLVGDLPKPRDLPPDDGFKGLNEGYISAEDALLLFSEKEKGKLEVGEDSGRTSPEVSPQNTDGKKTPPSFPVINLPIGRL